MINQIKRLFLILTIVLLYGCLSKINPDSANNIKIDEIIIPTAQCNMCVANIGNAVNGVDGILKYKVALETDQVKIKYNADRISLQIIEQLISKAGYQANNLPAYIDAYNKLAMCCKLPKDRH